MFFASGDPIYNEWDFRMAIDLFPLWLSLRVASLATLFALAAGLWLGWLLARRRFRGREIVDAAVTLPHLDRVAYRFDADLVDRKVPRIFSGLDIRYRAFIRRIHGNSRLK